MYRRAYLATLGTMTTLTLAGCSGSSGDGGTETATDVSTTAPSTDATTVTSETAMTERTGTPTVGPTTTAERTTAATSATPSNRLYNRTRVTITDENGTRLGVVRAWVADTAEKRYTGLSDTGRLPNGTGMLFTYDESSEHTYVMRGMDFPLDIVFIGADGRITAIKSAPAPGPGEDGNDIQRTGWGQYVLEVPRGWMARHGIHVGDHANIGGNETTTREP